MRAFLIKDPGFQNRILGTIRRLDRKGALPAAVQGADGTVCFSRQFHVADCFFINVQFKGQFRQESSRKIQHLPQKVIGLFVIGDPDLF